MSSNIRIQRICMHCGEGFIAKTTVTKYCGDTCAKRAYKARKKAEKIESSNHETKLIISKPIEELKAKEFLSVRDVSILLGCSIRTTYRLINDGTIKATNLAERMTRVRRSELNKLLE
ncbi:MAG: helix-turn-helix domain-containing protein [Maribacter sp.]|uniref:helix-turn-helix transcriptional regulator n=1 Tax=Maribacter sp. TaxID=1897614 RepID=UPI003297F0AB